MYAMGYPKQIVVDAIHGKRDGDIAKPAEFDRDMTRLKDLRSHYQSPGLNTWESNEVEELLGKYGIEYNAWVRGEMFL